MIFTSPEWVPQDILFPQSALVGDFVMTSSPGSQPNTDKAVIILADSGKTVTVSDIKAQVDRTAAALKSITGWSTQADSEESSWDKVVGIFAENSVDYMIICWAVHRLGGICLLLHSTSTSQDIQKHLSKVSCGTFFTSPKLVPTIEQARKEGTSIPEALFVIGGDKASLTQGYQEWGHVLQSSSSAQTEITCATPTPSQVAYLCPTSGTSGAQKLAKITHKGIIANILQSTTLEGVSKQGRQEVGLGILPLSHIYGILISHLMIWRRDTMVLHETFDMQKVLQSIALYRIERLYLVPSIVAALVTNKILFKIYDLSSVNSIATGAGSMSSGIGEQLRTLQPSWKVLAGYGTTESGGLATYTSADDICLGSSGSLLPYTQAMLVADDGVFVDGYDTPGEILLRSPSVIAGYLGQDEAELFTVDGWLRTGDVGLFRKGPNGYDHLFVIDRLKDMLKVKGMQVAPADIEAELLRHPSVAEAAVVGSQHEVFGERAKAWIVPKEPNLNDTEVASLKESISDHVAGCLPETHWLGNRIDFLPALPKNSSGKVLKRLLRKYMTVSRLYAKRKVYFLRDKLCRFMLAGG